MSQGSCYRAVESRLTCDALRQVRPTPTSTLARQILSWQRHSVLSAHCAVPKHGGGARQSDLHRTSSCTARAPR
eukprot:1224481-Rhodomonas_salina.7